MTHNVFSSYPVLSTDGIRIYNIDTHQTCYRIDIGAIGWVQLQATSLAPLGACSSRGKLGASCVLQQGSVGSIN